MDAKDFLTRVLMHIPEAQAASGSQTRVVGLPRTRGPSPRLIAQPMGTVYHHLTILLSACSNSA